MWLRFYCVLLMKVFISITICVLEPMNTVYGVSKAHNSTISHMQIHQNKVTNSSRKLPPISTIRHSKKRHLFQDNRLHSNKPKIETHLTSVTTLPDTYEHIRHHRYTRRSLRNKKSTNTKLVQPKIPQTLKKSKKILEVREPSFSFGKSPMQRASTLELLRDFKSNLTDLINAETIAEEESSYEDSDSYDLTEDGTSVRVNTSDKILPKVDVVTKFLRIVETQHLLGDNCKKGTSFNLGEGVVDKYAQERFRMEAELAVNRANLYTRFWKYSSQQFVQSEYLIHAELLTFVEMDDDIFCAGNCYDKNQYPGRHLYCPFAHRTPDGLILVKDLSVEYKYLKKSDEWFYKARQNAERVVKENKQFTTSYHSYTYNDTAHTQRQTEEILTVKYKDGVWSKPYYDCGGGNIWMMTYTIPFFGFENNTYFFKGTSGIDIALRRVDIDQCPLPRGSKALNIFANSHKCKKETTECVPVNGLGFRRGSYKCMCKEGFYFPDVTSIQKYFNGSDIEEEYENIIMGRKSLYEDPDAFQCLPCAEGCELCEDDSPCVVSLNWLMRSVIVILGLIIILCLPVIVFFIWKFGDVKVVKAASPVLLAIIIGGAFFIYWTTLVLYPIPSTLTCTLRVWLREIGFSLSYGALMLKTWRISVIFQVKSAKAVKITDLDLIKRLGIIVGIFAAFLAVRTVVAPPTIIVSMTADGLKAFLCSLDWWDHSFTCMEMIFLVWGIRLCIMVRKAPSEFNESKFISMAIYNEFLLTLFLNVSMIFLQSPANPDLLFIIFFCHTQLTMTFLIALIFGSKAYMLLKGHGKGEESISMARPNVSKFLKPRPNSTVMASVTSSSAHLDDVQEDFKKIYMQLESMKERHARLGNQSTVGKIIAMQEAATSVVSKLDNNCINTMKEERKKSVNDGVVMRPVINNILANVTDKIVCATLPDSPNELVYQWDGEVESIRRNAQSITEKRRPRPTKLYAPVLNQLDISTNINNLILDNVITDICPNNQEKILNCSLPSSGSLSQTYEYSPFSSRKTMHDDEPNNIHHMAVTPDHTVKLNPYFRGCISLEDLRSNIWKPKGYSTSEAGRSSLLSLHSSSTKLNSHVSERIEELKNIRNCERARAFILFNLSDKDQVTHEVTV